MTHDSLIIRLTAANPSPLAVSTGPDVARPTWTRRRLRVAAVLAVAAVAVPAVAFADSIGGLLGISNQGTTVAASDTPFSSYPQLNAAMQQLGLTTMQLLGTEQGISFYAARNPDGHFCFAVASPAATGIGCRLDNEFPSAQDPLIDIFSTPKQIAGFAADDVADVVLLELEREHARNDPSHRQHLRPRQPARGRKRDRGGRRKRQRHHQPLDPTNPVDHPERQVRAEKSAPSSRRAEPTSAGAPRPGATRWLTRQHRSERPVR